MIILLMILSLFASEYVDFQRGFRITVPDEYQMTTAHNKNPFLYIGKDLASGSYPNLNIVQSSPVADEIVDNSDEIVNALKDRLSEYELLKKEQFSFQDSEKGVKLHGRWKSEGSLLRNIQYYFLMNEYLYIVTGTSLASEFDEDLPLFEKTVLSIKKL